MQRRIVESFVIPAEHGGACLVKKGQVLRIHLVEGQQVGDCAFFNADDPKELKRFLDAHQGALADDWSGAPVFLAANAYRLKVAEEDWKQIRFAKTREHAE